MVQHVLYNAWYVLVLISLTFDMRWTTLYSVLVYNRYSTNAIVKCISYNTCNSIIYNIIYKFCNCSYIHI